MLPLRARVYLGIMIIKEYSAFPKASALLEPYPQIVLWDIQDTRWGGGQSVYSAASADWANNICGLFNTKAIPVEEQ